MLSRVSLRIAVEHLWTVSDAERYGLHLRLENASEDSNVPGFLRATEQLNKKELTNLVCQLGPSDGDSEDPLPMGDEDDLIKAEGPILDPVAKDEEPCATLERSAGRRMASGFPRHGA